MTSNVQKQDNNSDKANILRTDYSHEHWAW